MAITDTTAEAPCPIFAGRGISTRGFTLALPEKGYLSCTPDNIDSENYVLGVYNYDLATRVKNDSADTIAFGVWVETGSDTDAVATAKHMHAVDFSMKVTEAYTFDAGSERNADIRCARVRIEALNSVDGVIHAMYLNTRLHASNTPTFKGRYLEYTSSYGGIGLEIRTEIIGETGTITLGDGTDYGLCGLLITHKADAGVTAVTGAYQAIALHCPYEGTAFSGSTYGIQFINTVILAGTAFDYGIFIPTGTVVKAISIGLYATRFSWAVANYSLIDVWVTCTSTTSDTGVMTLRVNSSATMTEGKILGIECQGRTTGTALIRGLEAHAVWEASSTIMGGISCGLYARAEASTSVTTTGDMYAGEFYVKSQSATTGKCAAIFLWCNSSTQAWDDAFIYMLGYPTYVMAFTVANNNCTSTSQTCSDQVGWMKVLLASGTKYIALYDTVT